MTKAPTALRQAAISLLTAILVVSCNGGMLASGGIGGTGVTAVSVGPITQFGSIFVNGVEYDLTKATILVNGSQAGTAGEDGNQVALTNLAIGQVVKVTGTVDSSGTKGSATQVTFSADVNGPINTVTPVDATTKELTILGQSVVVDQDTKFVGTLPSNGKSFSIDDVAGNMVVEVSGLTNAGGKLHATYVKFEQESAGANTQVDVKGTIQALNANAGTFNINGQTIDYVTLQPTFEHLAGSASLANGQVVEVEGLISNGVLQAQKISLESGGLGDGQAQSADIEGFITAFTSTKAFTVDSQAVTTDAATTYSRGLATDLGSGVKVEVKGTLKNGVLTASTITFKDDVELEANVSSVSAVNASNGTLTLTGLPSITVNVNSLTQLDGDNFNALTDLGPDMYVKVRGRVDSTGTSVTATALERQSTSASSDITLQGPVANISAPLVTILGLDVDTGNISTFSSGDTHPSGSAFVSALATGNVVKVEGTLSGTTPIWQNMELEK